MKWLRFVLNTEWDRQKWTESEPASVGWCWYADSSGLWGLSHAPPRVRMCAADQCIHKHQHCTVKALREGSNPDRNCVMSHHVCVFSCHSNVSCLVGKLTSAVIPGCLTCPARVCLLPMWLSHSSLIVFTCEPALNSLRLARSGASLSSLAIVWCHRLKQSSD